MELVAFLDAHSGSLMLIVTIIYVVATIAICKANFDSAKAARQQLAEMKKQYEEEIRPNIQVELKYLNRTVYALRFHNYGKNTAHNVRIEVSQDFIASNTNGKIGALLINQKDKYCIIGAGQFYDLYICDNSYKTSEEMVPVCGELSYTWNSKSFSDSFSIDLKEYMSFFSVESYEEKKLKLLEKQVKELSGINNALNRM